ncbi:SPOR domain-containing protein [Methylobacter sp.]|uniref:SPOR domain-containing protein n=1 Tax=Methylobacter sp. TaxID=2051955 RepID=UPI003DA61B9A
MAIDYKHRAAQGRTAPRGQKPNRHESVGVFKWMLITALIIAFVVFLVYLRSTGSKQNDIPQVALSAAKSVKTEPVKKEQVQQKKAPEPVHQPPQFDFYTILPQKEVVVPDYEIKTRAREELIGKVNKPLVPATQDMASQAKGAQYMVQAGSFREFQEADKLRAKLALMGIESRVEKAKVGNTVWHRVKMGPYAQMTSVSAIRTRLRQNGIDVIVTESGR